MSEEEYAHYKIIRTIVQEEVKPINSNINTFILIALGVFGFMFITQFIVYKELQAKADSSSVERDYIQKLTYYQIEEDEHRLCLEIVNNPTSAAFIYDKINDNIAASLGFKYTTRSTTK